jgi:hypothetical protein
MLPENHKLIRDPDDSKNMPVQANEVWAGLEEAQRKIRVKENMNPSIEVLAYDELVAFARRTKQWIVELREQDVKTSASKLI